LYRHHRLNALGEFEDTKPRFDRLHWGAAVGGPIKRNQTHFFVAFERKNENAFATIETGGIFPELEGSVATPFDRTMLFARLDHRLTASHDLMVRWAADLGDVRSEIGESETCAGDFSAGATLSSAAYGVDTETRSHSLMATHRWAASSTVLNEATVHYASFRRRRERITETPTMKFPSICTGGNDWAWNEFQSRVELKEELSLALDGSTGSHQVKFGAHVQVVRRDHNVFNFANGLFVFSSDTASLPSAYVRNFSVPFGGDETSTQLAVFAQDDWSPVPRLTLNLGIRYDIETNGTNQNHVISEATSLPFISTNPRPIDANNIALRIGFSWDATGDGRTVVRGGFGIFYDQLRTWLAGLESQRFALAFVPNPGTLDPDSIFIDPDAIPYAGIVMDSVMQTPFTRQYSVGIERDLSHDLVAGVEVMFVQGRNIPFRQLKNPVDPMQPPARKFAGFGPLGMLRNLGETNAKLLILRARKVLSWGRFDVHYTLADRKTTADRWLDVLQVSDTTNDFSSEFGPAAWDERHRLVLFGSAQLPMRFSMSVKTIYSSARPYTAVAGFDLDGVPIRPSGEGRNARRGPNFFRVDFGVRRVFRVLSGDVSVVFNVYNVLNRTNLNPGTVVPAVESPLFGRAQGAFPGRQAELGVEVVF
ncbi:MAG: TonB-dependent receptor, partial [Gemmatimonadota bacterium]